MTSAANLRQLLNGNKMNLKFEFRKFEALDQHTLYEMLQLRVEVFVLEQNCPYQDLDGKDTYPETIHVLGYDEISGKLVAYCRILEKGVSYTHSPSIGRVITAITVRGTGAGKKLMQTALTFAEHTLGFNKITISAQSHLQRFYEGLGFKRTSKREYLEDNIPHREMEWNKK